MQLQNFLASLTAIPLMGGLAGLYAATPEFSGATGGNWSDAGNWMPNGVPAAADTARFTSAAATSVRLDGSTATSSHLSFGNGAGFTIGNASGDTAKITHTSKTVTVADAFTYAINLTNGGGSGATSTGAYDITSATFNIAAGGKLNLEGRYFGTTGAVRTITKSTGTGTLELTGDYVATGLQCTLNAGTLVLNGTGTNHRLLGLGSIAAGATLQIASANPNLATGISASHTSTGIRGLAGTVDLNGFNTSTTRIQGTATTGVITNRGATDAVLTLGDFGTTTGLAATVTNPVFGGILQDGPTNKLGLTITGGGGSLLSLTLMQPQSYTGPTTVTNGSSLSTRGLADASAVNVSSNGTLLVEGPLANTAGITVSSGMLDIRGAFSAGVMSVTGGTVKLGQNLVSAMPVSSLNQSGGSIELDVASTGADKLTTAGNMTFAGGVLTVMLRSAPVGTVVLAEYGSITGTPSMTYVPDLSTTRLSAPTVDAVTGNKVRLSLTGSAADLTWTGAASADWNLSSGNWDKLGSASPFFNLDRVSFTDAPATKTINLATTVTPGQMTFTNAAGSYTVNGTGGIAGLGDGLVKNGSAALNLGGINSFIGPVLINQGQVMLLTPQALGSTAGVIVASNGSQVGQLNLNGQALADVGRAFSISISGHGLAADGAIINTGGNLIAAGTRKSGIRNVTLVADSSVGGSGGFDIGTGGTVDGGGFTLTKKGGNEVLINGPSTNLKTVIETGTLSTSVSDGFGTNLLVKSGTTASCSNLGGTYNHSTNVIVESGGILQSGTSVNWNGPFQANGDLTINIDQVSTATMTFANNVTVPGNLSRGGAASGGTTTFLGDLSVTGSITMTAGEITFDGSSGNLTASNIVLGAAAGAISFRRSSSMTFANVISGVGGVKQTGSGTTTLSGINTYTGLTTVSAGTLLINGNQTASGNVTVSSGATLGGSGSTPAAVTITGTVAPGNATLGTLRTGAAAKATTINGTLRIETNGSAATPTDKLITNGALTLGAASVLDFDSIGAALTAPAYVIARYEGGLTGTFGSVIDLPVGYTLVYNYFDGSSANNIAFITPYHQWIRGYFPDELDPSFIGPTADPDHDGIPNLLENYFGADPLVTSTGLSQIVRTGAGSFTFSHSRADAPVAGYTAAYQWSTDLTTWHSSGATAGGVSVVIAPSVLTDNPSPANDEINVLVTISSGSAPAVFVRLVATLL